MAKLLNEQEKQIQKAALKGKISFYLTPLKDDYSNDFVRGTVDWNPENRNYSFHVVTIPDGTVVRDMNFSQVKPHTVSIIGKNLHFIGCNLHNVELDASWSFNSCLLLQSKYIKKNQVLNTTDFKAEDEVYDYEFERQKEKDGQWVTLETQTITIPKDQCDNMDLRITEQNRSE